jgi:putative oxidoreductase
MFVASMMHLNQGHGLKEAAHAVELAIVFLGLLFIGPGSIRFSSK